MKIYTRRPQGQNPPSPPHLTINVLCITLNIALKYTKMFGWSISFLFMKLLQLYQYLFFTKTSTSIFLKRYCLFKSIYLHIYQQETRILCISSNIRLNTSFLYILNTKYVVHLCLKIVIKLYRPKCIEHVKNNYRAQKTNYTYHYIHYFHSS